MSALLRFLARIRFRLLAFNALLVFLPVGGMLFLDNYEKQLLDDRERAMVDQGRLLAAALSPAEGPPDDARNGERNDTLDPEFANDILIRLQRQSDSRIRVVDTKFQLIADSSLLGPQREPVEPIEPIEPETGAFESLLYRMGSLPFRIYRELFVPPRPPHGSADIYVSGRPIDGSEIRAALAGRYGAATRISSGGQRSVTLYSAVPIRGGDSVVGAVLISQSTYRILHALYKLRTGLVRVFLASLGAAVVLSLLVSQTIARPLVRLRNQADAIVDRRGRLRGRFEAPDRRDEIGDLSRTLERLRRRLEDHINEVESFAGDVSHEFKNPLASIRTAADVLLDLESLEDRKRFTDVIQREVARMERMLSAVREIGQLDAQVEVEEGESIALGEQLAGVVEAHRLRGHGAVGLEQRARDLVVFGSPERLVQVWENLIDNAQSFNSPLVPVEISLDSDGADAIVRVLDRGPGVPESDFDRIFERFISSRSRDTTSIHTGFGLAIVKAIVENAGGTVRVGDRIGGGACFEVRLPLDDSARER